MIEYPRDHWKLLLPASSQEEFQKLIEMRTEEEGYQVIKDLRTASAAIGKRRNYCGRMFVTHYPFLVCVNRQKGAAWRLSYRLFERLTEAYFFREGIGAPDEGQTALMLPSPSSEQAMPPATLNFRTETEQVIPRLHTRAFQDFIGGYTLPLAHAEFETWYVKKVLDVCNGNRNAASKMMGISRANFYRKLWKYRLS